MAQQDFTGKFWPIANANASEVVPGAAILQTRNGLDEPITLAGNMVFDSVSGLWVPVSESNPLPTKATLTGRATLVAMGLNEVIPPGVEIFRPGVGEAPVIQAHRRYGFILTFVGVPEEKRRARVSLVLRRLMPDGSKSGSSEYVMGTRWGVLVADGSPGTPSSLIMEPVHVPAEWINFGILNTGTEDVTTNWYVVEV